MENSRTLRDGTSDPKPHNACWEYARSGNCKFGNRCHYSHEGAPKQPKKELPPEVARFLNKSDHSKVTLKVDGKLREWKQLLLKGSSISRPPPAIVSRFFVLALELMKGDVSSSQDVVKHVASGQGLLFVKDVVERHVNIANRTGPSISFWTTEIKPLFRLITHSRVTDSAVLEVEAATIYNFVLGIGGRRMKGLFDYLVKLIQVWPHESNSSPDLTRMSTVELSLAVLTKILDCNTVNIVNETFALFNQQLAEAVAESTSDEESFARLQSLKYIEYIRRRLEVGNDIVAYEDLPVEPVIREKFVLRRDFPGRLSAEGPRHDNDFADISKISILPTFEEIMSPRAEYLPLNDSSTWHVGGIRGRIDREFRLLREDTIGQLRDTVRHVQEQLHQSPDQRLTTKHNVRTYTYEHPTPINVMFGRDGGLELLVQCQQLATVQKLSAKERTTWWQQSRRLQAGALLCLVDATGSVAFFVVSQSTMRSKADERKFGRQTSRAEKQEETGQPAPSRTLSDDAEFLYVTLQLVENDEEEVQKSLEWYRPIGVTKQRFLVEFPGVLLDSFKHTLAALQDLYKRPDVPFSDTIASPPEAAAHVVVQPPLFARRPGFNYDAGCLRTGLMLSPMNNTDSQELASRTGLDESQSMAVLNTLSREISLVQGPPGTGKSYTGEKIIQILLQNKTKAKLGPILCVCYTNHALDQLLEHLLDKGIEKVMRIGSRSKSERMVSLNLTNIVQGFDKTKSESHEIGHAIGEIKRVCQDTVSSLRELAVSQSTATVKDHLQSFHPWHFIELFPPVDEDGWITVSNQKPSSAIENWLKSGHEDLFKYRPVEDLKNCNTNLWEMSSFERNILFKHWLQEIRSPIISTLLSLQKEYQELCERRNKIGSDVKLRCLQSADVIGVTTTGLARNISILRRLRSKVMVCEEAGEVLEAHVLTALLPSLEQAILIGDHLQLRPQINNYELQSSSPQGAKYSLDTSLFERLVQPLYDTDARVPYSTLETQRRMHPSIAALIRSTLYPSLKNADNVSCYPEVKGIRKRLFWMQHEHLEAGVSAHDPLNTSHSNDFEVEMTTALVSHLIRQGEYQNGQIAVLTPYLGQLHKLRRRMASIFEICINDRDNEDLEAMDAELDTGDSLSNAANAANISKSSLLKTIRVATVDNFQGEEAEVVVISLVRSNPQRKCGFLSPSICGETCPDATYCQECASDEIKATCVDFLEWKTYGEIDLEQEPCIFPDCGHFLTVASMDGQMDMASHYVVDAEGHPVGINKVSEPFSMDGSGVPVCASCRGSLRHIARYGRIVRRAMLDEATKKFISWSKAKHIRLASSLLEAETALETAADLGTATVKSAQSKRPRITLPRFSYLGYLDRETRNKRYGKLMRLWKDMDRFVKEVQKEEQPFQRVADLVRHTNRQRKTQKQFRFDDSVIQVKSSLFALLLRLKCEIDMMSDFFFKTKGPAGLPKDFVLDLAAPLEDCDLVIELAHRSRLPREQVQALIYKANLCAIGPDFVVPRTTGANGTPSAGPDRDDKLSSKQLGNRCLDQARELLNKYESTRAFGEEIESMQKMLNNGLYRPATIEELRAAFEALAGEFGPGGTHWYACENGHYFTIGECGRPMEEARCPDCGAGIGGQGHNLAAGVRVADTIEELGRGIGRL
ncbi:related to ECM32-DNA dependent ATPase/DNA helicase B [Claviceps purpurea 20.1]|uniref:Related to ECM32-DNA dependent ATPase/DNA helicase B n=1 Tax=Claviceps purpurea (strain 20.1) TaxID=1111077 RepID=M1WAG3_CLAP2|nr:related to ECM32-DNA dependent ATPase/DNA helicase B [Claviceps purpurea 20.1]